MTAARKKQEEPVELEPNPAVVHEPAAAELVEKTYMVAGPHEVLDHKPGDTFTALIDPGLEAFLLEVGHLKIKEQ